MTIKRTFFLIALALGLAFDYLFWGKTPGVSYFIYSVLCLLAGYALLRWHAIQPARENLALFAPALIFAALTFIRREPFTALFNLTLSLLSMAILAATCRRGGWGSFSLADYLSTAFTFAGRVLSFAWLPAPEGAPTQVSQPKTRRDLIPLLRGAALALPVLLLFGALFASADLVFSTRVNALLAGLNLNNLGELLFRATLILTATYLLAGVYLHAAFYSQNKSASASTQAQPAPMLGFTEAVIVLGSLLTLFTAFVLIQFQYFFSGSANISSAGFTYSEYARRGFGELLAVAFFSLALLQVLGTLTRRESPNQRRAFSALSIALVALVLVILFSAFQRLSLYETAYGFSRLRTYAHVFMLWLGALLIAAAALETARRPRAFLLAALLALFGFGASLNLLNVDAFIARRNIQRAQSNSPLDVAYLASLSSDAVPALVAALTSADLNATAREGVAAALVCRQRFAASLPARAPVWQSFHLSQNAARRALQNAQPALQGFSLLGESDLLRVLSPSGAEYPCYSTD